MKLVTCKRCGTNNLTWSQGGYGRWTLVYIDNGTGVTKQHVCEGGDLQIVACKYCASKDLHWSKETMEDGQVKNILCESYGLPHDCQERKDAKKAEWEAIKKEKRDQYYSEKNLLEELVKTNRISQKECNQQLYRCRRNIWPSLFAKK